MSNTQDYDKLQPSKLKKLVLYIKINTFLIQLTYIAFPLAVYMIYNKVIANGNKNTIIFVVIFLLVVTLVQLGLKVFEIVYRNRYILDQELKAQQHNIYRKINHFSDPNLIQSTIMSLSSVSNAIKNKLQSSITKSYASLMLIYMALMLAIGKYIALSPALIFGLNYLIAIRIMHKYKYHYNKYLKAYTEETIYIKEILRKNKIIKGLNISKDIFNKYYHSIYQSNKHKSNFTFYKSLLQKINAIMGIVNVSLILLFGRYLFSIGIINMEQIITCSLLTMWVTRSFSSFVNNINANIMVKPFDDGDKEISKAYKKTYNVNDVQDGDYEITRMLESKDIIHLNSDLSTLIPFIRIMYNKVSLIDHRLFFFYGSIIENITMFDESKEEEAKKLVSLFKIQHLVYDLPYVYNYVIIGNDDDAICYDLAISINIIRELLTKPEILIVNRDINRINNNIHDGIKKYALKNSIKLVVKKSSTVIKGKIEDILETKYHEHKELIE